MLVLTQNASAVIDTIVDQAQLPAEGGVRIAGGSNGSDSLSIATSDGPQATDQVVEDGSARVFLEHAAAEMLDDKILDAQLDDKGGVQFLIAMQ